MFVFSRLCVHHFIVVDLLFVCVGDILIHIPSGGDREQRPALPVPNNPPFIAYVGNLPFHASEDDIGEFFGQQCKVKNVRLVKDHGDQRSKGYSYVEFEDKKSLEDALTASGEDFMGRRIRVDVAEQKTREFSFLLT
jgi:translation initiation factor 4B